MNEHEGADMSDADGIDGELKRETYQRTGSDVRLERRVLCVEPRGEREVRRDANHLREEPLPVATHGAKRLRTEDAPPSTVTRQTVARGDAARDQEQTYAMLTLTGGDSASDHCRHRGPSQHERREDVGIIARRRITGKRRRPEVAHGPRELAATSTDQLTSRGCVDAGADMGTVGEINPLPPCDVLHKGNAEDTAELTSFHHKRRRRTSIIMGGTRIPECRNMQGIGEVPRDAAEEGEMNTIKSTLFRPSVPSHSGAARQMRTTVEGLGNRADHAADGEAAAVQFSTTAATCSSPPESVG